MTNPIMSSNIRVMLWFERGDTRFISEFVPDKFMRFSREQRQGLRHLGYEFYGLTGECLQSLRLKKCAMRSMLDEWATAIELISSARTEVAIMPDRLFLPESNRKSLEEQQRLTDDFGKTIEREVPGVFARLGSVAEYAELALAHARSTGGSLFGHEHGYCNARTNTIAGKTGSVIFGDYYVDGPLIGRWSINDGSPLLWAVPLIVPRLT